MPTTLIDLQNRRASGSYHAQCKRCFMTGKACIYQRDIAQHLRSKQNATTASSGLAFMLMPFQSTLDEVYRAQLEPCLLTVVEEVRRADDVARTGYVICEKICKQIQLADVICAEISCDNANVFYELGLAYAIDRNIALFIQKSVHGMRSEIVKKLSLNPEHYNGYDPFEMLEARTVNLWNASKCSVPPTPRNDEITVLLADTTPFQEDINGQTLTYTIDGLCRGAIHRTLDKFKGDGDVQWLLERRHTVTLQKGAYIENAKGITFSDVEERIRNSACVIIATHAAEPCSYFWLGFAHGLEKDVIPVTVHHRPPVLSTPVDQPEHRQVPSDERSNVGFPFDMRALWHVAFAYDKPRELEEQLESILRLVSGRNKDKLHRTGFWEPFLEEGSVSIFVGSVELTEKNKRHVVGEWDYRTVSELTSFFASIKETMETSIQTPTFQASMTLKGADGKIDEQLRDSYAQELLKKLTAGNSIVLASADVNDMTEVSLAIHAGVKPFVSESWRDPSFNGVVGFKPREEAAFSTPSVYFQSVDPAKAQGQRGFYDVKGGNVHVLRTYGSPYVPYSERREKGYSVYFSHVAKFRLPESNHWTVVLQGITGPATLGVAQALTGGINRQFTIFSSAVTSEKRESLFNAVAEESDTLREFLRSDGATPVLFEKQAEAVSSRMTSGFGTSDAIEAVIRVFVMDGGDQRHDERLIIWWDVKMEPRRIDTTKAGHRR